LSDGGETTVLDLGGIEGDAVLGELETLLDEGGKFTDATALLAEHFLGVCCADDWTTVRTSSCFWEMRAVLMSVTVGVTLTSTPE